MTTRRLAKLAVVVAACAFATALMAMFTETSSPLALLGWMIFFLSIQGPVLLGTRDRQLACARWLRRG